MNIKYYRDDGRNFMVINTDVIDENDYQYRMTLKNRMEHFLPHRLRNLDEGAYLYYDISGYTSLENRYTSGKLSGTEIRRLFTDLQSACKELSGYLLDIDGMLLHPSCMFYSLREQRFVFCYTVSRQQEGTGRAFGEWLTQHIDAGDRDAADMAYTFASLLQEENGCLTDALLSVLKEEPQPESEKKTISEKEEVSSENGLTASDFLTEEDWMLPEEDADLKPQQAVYGSREDEIPEEGSRARLAYAVMAVIFMVTWVAALCMRMALDLTGRENILNGAVAIVAFGCMLVSLFLWRPWKKSGEGILPIGNLRKEPEALFDLPDTPDGMSELLFRDRAAELDALYGRESNPEMQYRTPKAGRVPEFDDTDTETGTMLLQPEAGSSAHRLYSVGDERLIRIDLTKLPLTVGKLPGVADFLLKKDGVSRLHVSFFEEAGDIRMKDLNSTNGTWRNGRKLEAGESVALKEGDEVRIGAVEFLFT